MIANIELKSLDFDDENFSPVFNRSKKEFFLELSEKYKKDISRVCDACYVGVPHVLTTHLRRIH